MKIGNLCHNIMVVGMTAGWMLIATVVLSAESTPSVLKLRAAALSGQSATVPASQGLSIPRDAVDVFLYEGEPSAMRVTDRHLAVDYGRSGVLFDRATGKVIERFTVADGWPKRRSAEYPGKPGNPFLSLRTVGPGVLNPDYAPPGVDMRRLPRPGERLPLETLVETRFDGITWRAMQPRAFLNGIEPANVRDRSISWSEILARLNEACDVEAVVGHDKPSTRFTMAEGLASNIVTHLVAHEDALWAACVDIYDPKAGKWGPGGLSRYDKHTKRWERIAQIDGRPVRWVTLLMTVGDDLWVGFREGDGVDGDAVAFGMGLYAGTYRPRATSVVLARLSAGRWTTYGRDRRDRKGRADIPGVAPSTRSRRQNIPWPSLSQATRRSSFPAPTATDPWAIGMSK